MRSIDRIELLRLIDEENVQVIDVLPEPEFIEGHIPGAVNIPLKQLTVETISVLDPGRPVAVYCHDGL